MQVRPSLLEGSALPPSLADLSDPPSRLWLHGVWPRGPAVALVGTRRPTREAAGFTERLAADLCRAGVVVLSGGAVGIDAAAHRGALRAGGQTAVVAPAAWDVPFPAEHRELFREVCEGGGAYLTHMAPTERATYASFFRRNALLAALARAVVMVEAPLRSGARNAMAHARRLARGTFVVLAPPWNERGTGALAELRLGATGLGSVTQLLRWLSNQAQLGLPLTELSGSPAPNEPGSTAGGVSQDPSSRDWLEARLEQAEAVAGRDGRGLLAWISEGGSCVDAAARALRLRPAVTSCLITELQLAGLLGRDEAGQLVLVPRPGHDAAPL